jgi:hypothetical protein
LPETSFVIAEGFYLAVLFALGSHIWARMAGSDRSVGTAGFWYLFRLDQGVWLAFLGLSALARWTWLDKLRLPATSASVGWFRASAVLCCAQLTALFLVGPIFSVIFAPFTLGVAFILTFVANVRVIIGVMRR